MSRELNNNLNVGWVERNEIALVRPARSQDEAALVQDPPGFANAAIGLHYGSGVNLGQCDTLICNRPDDLKQYVPVTALAGLIYLDVAALCRSSGSRHEHSLPLERM